MRRYRPPKARRRTPHRPGTRSPCARTPASSRPLAGRTFAPFLGRTDDAEDRRARIAVTTEKKRPFQLVLPQPKRRPKRDRHARTRVAFLRYGYYDVVFKFFVEQVLDADYLPLPEPTRRTVELGSRNSNDYVCAPFKHILGDYIEALELGADVLVQFAGPCRLGYYGELQESILRDLGYEFEMLNFATVTGKPLTDYIEVCKKKVNPDLSVPHGVRGMLAAFKMIECLDEANDFYLAQRVSQRCRSPARFPPITTRCARPKTSTTLPTSTDVAWRPCTRCPCARTGARCA